MAGGGPAGFPSGRWGYSGAMNPSALQRDARVRLAAFRWLEEQVGIHGDVLPWSLLLEGFTFEGRRVPLLSQQGIFKPAVLPEIPLSIRTSAKGPYDDHFGPDDLLRYAYRGTDPNHRDNVGLRKAMESRAPLVYLHGVVPGRYLVVWPVFVVGDDPGALTFTVAADETLLAVETLRGLVDRREPGKDRYPPPGADTMSPSIAEKESARRVYLTSSVKVRLHQRGFRERVLQAYREHCALCRLRHRDLLDAAHIVPDAEEGGEPVVTNGLALCKLHHAAFDARLLGIRPDYVVEVHPRILRERDGPMLRHGLQGLHGSRLYLPRGRDRRPDPDRLEWRYRRYLEAV